MKNNAAFLVVSVLIILPRLAHAQDYVTGLLSNITKSQSTEALVSLGQIKSEILGCLQVHEGLESACNQIKSDASPNFTYEFLQSPTNGSQAWAIRASGNPKGKFKEGDQITLTSDKGGKITCASQGQLTGAC